MCVTEVFVPIGKKSVSMLVPCACVRSCQRVLRACVGVSERERTGRGGGRERDRQTEAERAVFFEIFDMNALDMYFSVKRAMALYQ